jgi:hypothetical protein
MKESHICIRRKVAVEAQTGALLLELQEATEGVAAEGVARRHAALTHHEARPCVAQDVVQLAHSEAAIALTQEFGGAGKVCDGERDVARVAHHTEAARGRCRPLVSACAEHASPFVRDSA